MNTQESKTRTNTDVIQPRHAKASFVLANSELALWPYRSFAKALLQAHDNLAAFVDMNRKLADEFQDIVRREQNLVMQVSEKFLRRVSDSNAKNEGKNFLPTEEIEEIYDSAMNGIREIGKVVAEAQIRSMETLSTQAKNAMLAASKPAQPATKAA